MHRNSNLALSGEPEPVPAETAEAILARLYAGESLDQISAERLFGALVDGRLPEASIAAMLIALRFKGETADEMIGAARALRAADEYFPRPDYLYADTCGTGGDGSSLINVSTAVAFVAAAAGLPVAKHGNRSVTSPCGSADVLEQLGVKLQVTAEVSRRALDGAGVCFPAGTALPSGLRHAGPVRRALKVRTIMNLLGPCLNPPSPRSSCSGRRGAADRAGGKDALLARRSATPGRARLRHRRDGAPRRDAGGAGVGGGAAGADPHSRDAGLKRRPLESLKGGGPEENAERMRALLKGEGADAEADAVALNAGALLFAAGLAADLREGVANAGEVIASGAAHQRLKLLVEATND
jgi:anthranilate phosphoribosyltransferase